MTLEDLDILFDGSRMRLEGWYRLGLWMAWHIAALSRTERLPALDTLLSRIDGEESSQKKPDGKPMDWRAMKSALKAATAQFGAPG